MAHTRQQLEALVAAFLTERTAHILRHGVGDWEERRGESPARTRLIEYLYHSQMARITARRMYRYYGEILRRHAVFLDFEDLVGEAQQALVRIVDDYDPSYGKPFRTCAISRMRQALILCIRRAFPGGRAALEDARRRIYLVSLEQDASECEHLLRREPAASAEELPWRAVQRAEIQRAVSALPEPERSLIVLKIFHGFTIEEAGQRVDPPMPRTTATDAYHRGLSQLSRSLAAYADGFDLRP